MNASEYSYIIAQRLKYAMTMRGLTQVDLIEKCRNLGLDISQSTLSRLLNGADRPDVYKVAIVCQALELEPNDLLSFDIKDNLCMSLVESSFITDATDKKFNGYMGKYYGYFYSTENNDTIHFGEFEFYKDTSTKRCRVSFSFETGKSNINNEPVRKMFIGTAKISDTLGAICCELTAQDTSGDLAYIIFKFDYILNQQCECRIGMVVTICAGLKRLPVAHKLLMCRQKISEADMPFIAGQLKLNDDIILVSEADYYDFIKDPMLPETFKQFDEQGNDLFRKKAANLVFYSFREDDILDIKSLSPVDKVKVVNLLRKYSSSKRCKKIGPKSENYVFKYLMEKKKRDNQEIQ